MPPPNGDSAVIRRDIRGQALLPDEEERTCFRVVRAAIGQSGKTAVNSLSAGLSLPK